MELATQMLFKAVQAGDEDGVKEALQSGADVDKARPIDMRCDGETSLWIAADKGHDNIVALLLEEGADKDKAAAEDRTPLFAAAMRGHETTVALLLEAGVDTDKYCEVQDDCWGGMAPVHVAARYGHHAVVALLLKHGVDKDQETVSGGWGTVLHVAAENGHINVVRLLLTAGADKDRATTWEVDNDRCTPLHRAAEYGQAAVIKLLLDAGADKDKVDNEGWTPALIATKNGRRNALRLLLQAGACPTALGRGTTILHEAVRSGNAGIVDDIVSILEPKAWHAFVMSGGTAAARAQNLPPAQRSFLGKIFKKDVMLHIKSFLKKPRYFIYLDAKDRGGESAAQIAQSKGHQAIVALLRDNGATIPA
eukprot:g3946.t1